MKLPFVDPVSRFWFSVVVAVAVGISTGTVALTNIVPDGLIKPATAWCGLIAFIGTTITATLNGMATTSQSRIASAAAVPEVKSILTTTAMADAAPSEKVIGPLNGSR